MQAGVTPHVPLSESNRSNSCLSNDGKHVKLQQWSQHIKLQQWSLLVSSQASQTTKSAREQSCQPHYEVMPAALQCRHMSSHASHTTKSAREQSCQPRSKVLPSTLKSQHASNTAKSCQPHDLVSTEAVMPAILQSYNTKPNRGSAIKIKRSFPSIGLVSPCLLPAGPWIAPNAHPTKKRQSQATKRVAVHSQKAVFNHACYEQLPGEQLVAALTQTPTACAPATGNGKQH
eukprot:451491-Pelagomonas_calceolata.AAC.2